MPSLPWRPENWFRVQDWGLANTLPLQAVPFFFRFQPDPGIRGHPSAWGGYILRNMRDDWDTRTQWRQARTEFRKRRPHPSRDGSLFPDRFCPGRGHNPACGYRAGNGRAGLRSQPRLLSQSPVDRHAPAIQKRTRGEYPASAVRMPVTDTMLAANEA